MAEFPAMPLWTDAYLGDTTHLTTIEHGAYFLLLVIAWRSRDGVLPDDDRMLARYTRLTPAQWKRMRPTLEPFFLVENGVWMQRRLRDELNAVRQRAQKASDAGHASARARALKTNGRHSTPVGSKLQLGADSPEPEPEPVEEESANADSKKGPAAATQALDAWNEQAEASGWPKVLKLTEARRDKINLRLKELNGLEGWTAVLNRAAGAAMLAPDPPTWWTLDFLIRNDTNPQKVLEGNYDRRFERNGPHDNRNDGPQHSGVRAAAAVLAEERGRFGQG